MFGFDKQKRLNRQLRNAAQKGDMNKIAQLLNAGAEIESRPSVGTWQMTALGIAALYGRAAAVTLLLDSGADIDAKDKVGETALINALIRKHKAVAEILIDRGADTTIVGHRGRSVRSLAAQTGDARLLKKILNEPEPPPPKENPDEVTFSRPLGDKLLEEVFNFAAKERISLLRAGPGKAVEAMTRDSFDALGDKAALRRAFDEYARRGGTVTEAEIFPDALGKLKPLPRTP